MAMSIAPLLFAASSIFGLSQAAPVSTSQFGDLARSLAARDGTAYKIYGGDGTVADGWPTSKDWVDFDTMWKNNSPLMKKSCTAGIPQNTDADIAAIKSGIASAASASKVDDRFILAVIMQESGGCVHVNQTVSPPPGQITNPGIMQTFNGKNKCNDNVKLTTPCPEKTIEGMVADGTGLNNKDGNGLMEAIVASKATDDSKYYKAARIYNSGSIAPGGNLGLGVATHCYSSDIANRLMGWLGTPKVCVEATIGSMKTGGGASGTTTGPTKESSAPSTSPTPTKATGATQAPSQVASATPTPSTVKSSGDGTHFAGAVKDCATFYTVKSGDNCATIDSAYGLTTGTLQKLNTGLDATCTNLELGVAYCVYTG